jgi:hypothetical protein
MMSPRFLVPSVLVFLVVACGGETVNVGSTSQMELQKNKDGSATGNGQTCSWDDSVSSDGTTTASPNGPYKVGDKFASPDGCNTCECTTQGIACTEIACSSPPGGGNGVGCTEEAKTCPDGTTVVRVAPSCEFAKCPGEEACPAVARICNDGSTAKPGPNCSHICPEDGNVACTDDAKLCPDGKTYVSRTGPNCEFEPCP